MNLILDKEIRKDNIEGLTCLLNDSDSSPSDSDWEYYCHLKTALRHKHKEIAKLLLQKGTICKKLSYGFQTIADNILLHLAVPLGCPEIFELLLNKGASFYAENNNHETPLILAALMGNDSTTDQILSSISTEKNCSRKDGFSHFHIACMRNNVEIIKGVLQRGVDINASINLKSSYRPGYTARHFAVEFQCIEAVKLLVNCGANITVQDKNELTPLHLAFGNQNETIIDLILSAHSFIPVNPQNSEGLSHLHIACTRNNPKIVEAFLRSGVDVNLKTIQDALNWSSYTPLCFAIEYRCMDVINMAFLVENIEFRRILESDDFNDEFQNYGYLLKLQLKKGLGRKKLLVPGRVSVRFLSGIQLPDDCSEQIIQYLSNKDLESIIKAVDGYEK